MHIRFATRLTLLLALLVPMPALAQGAYIGASVTGDVLRLSSQNIDTGADFSGSGEAIGFALRLGTPVGSIWGVEAELARSSEIRWQDDFSARPSTALTFTGTVDVYSVSTVPAIYSYSLKTRQRMTTFSTSAWVRQQVSQKVSLVYLGGLAFSRMAREAELSFVPLPNIIFVGVARPVLAPQTTKSIDYGTHPVAGVEAKIALTEHVEIVPGIRLMGLGSGWLVRPAVGIGWVW
jgi:hypothetical protein